MNYLTTLCVRLASSKGQTMAEYGLIISLVAIASVAAWTTLGGDISAVITSVTNSL
jgi:Flp pilus assembly pilin Flp